MKRGFSSLILVLTILSVQAQTNFFEGTWKEAFAEAQKQDKYLFIDCYTDWCGWCKVADKKTFPNKKVAEVLNTYFVSVKVDMERGEGVALAQKYRVTGFPSYLMFTPDGAFAKKMTGYTEKPEEFIAEVKKSMDEKGNPNYPSKLMDEVSFPSFYTKAFTNKDSDEKQVNPNVVEVNSWLSRQKDFLSEAVWSVIYRFPLNASNSATFLSSIREYVKVYGKGEVMDVVSKIAGQKLDVAVESHKQADLDVALIFVDEYMSENKEDTKTYFRLRFFEGSKDWQGYAKVAQAIIEKNGLANHINAVNNYSWTLYENATELEVLEMAIGWMSQVVELDPQYMYLDTYAALFFKAGKYDKAIAWADKAIAAGKKSEEDVRETEGLRDKIIAAKEGK